MYLFVTEILITVLFSLYVARAIYRITLHPLAPFPGPKLAAITDIYWAYYDIWYKGGGEMVRQLEWLHSIYGQFSS
jgi:hypothetical protein